MYEKIEFQDPEDNKMYTCFINFKDIQVLYLTESPDEGRRATFMVYGQADPLNIQLGYSGVKINDEAWEQINNMLVKR